MLYFQPNENKLDELSLFATSVGSVWFVSRLNYYSGQTAGCCCGAGK